MLTQVIEYGGGGGGGGGELVVGERLLYFTILPTTKRKSVNCKIDCAFLYFDSSRKKIIWWLWLWCREV